MGRRTTIFEDVAKLPWPVGVVAAGIIFVGLQVIQATESSNHMIEAIKPAIRIPAYIFIVLFLFSSLISFISRMRQQRQYVATKSTADIRSLSWQQFESFVGEYFREQGYSVTQTQGGSDNGVDLVLREDGEKTYVQCKHWKSNQVGVEKVRQLLGSMAAGGAQNGIFVTSSCYTSAAQKLARECGIRLIDGDELAELRSQGSDTFVCLTPFVQQQAPPQCPKCGEQMVERVARKGFRAGQSFWGCSSYPKCNGTRDMIQQGAENWTS